MNNVILMGRLTKDPEIRYSNNNNANARYTLAVDRKYKQEGGQTADFISCVSFGKTAEFLEKYCKKGTKLVVEGRIQTGSYEKDGQRIYTTDVVVDSVEFAESKGSESKADPSPTPNPSDDFMAIPDDLDGELPFN